MIQITEENTCSHVLIENRFKDKNVVVLFPMTRGADINLFRWEKIITTVNNSKVAALILIDKTHLHQASEYFVERVREIKPDLYIIQRPRIEPIHDSQSLIRLKDGLWIIQLHDDDDWDGVLEIPKGVSENSIVKTNFTIVSNGLKVNVDDLNWPACRSVFSLLPAKVWNRFADLVYAQGGHVAGSIDSSLNLVVNLIEPSFFSSDFRYFYDNRHWESTELSKKHLIKLTKEDGWGKFSTVEMSLVSRAIDGIASLIFFSDLYTRLERESQLEKWIQITKPHTFRIFLNRFEASFLILIMRLLGNYFQQYLRSTKEFLNTSILYKSILLSAWDASAVEDYLFIVEKLMHVQFLVKLQPRFNFWQSQLEKYSR